MKITLEHSEIDQALIDFVRKQGLDVKAGDIEIKVDNGKISASLATRFITAIDPKDSTPVKDSIPASEPIEDDREELKSQLDKLGIEYAPKARTATLQTLLDDAQKAQPNKVEPEPELPESVKESSSSGNIFSQESSTKEDAPFDGGTTIQESKEEPDDDKPLFGS